MLLKIKTLKAICNIYIWDFNAKAVTDETGEVNHLGVNDIKSQGSILCQNSIHIAQ
jgi:hypothetical protein